MGMLYRGSEVREPYIQLVKSLVEMEFDIDRSYEFYDGTLRREGVVYVLGVKEVYWMPGDDGVKDTLIIRDPTLREDILNMLALNPLYRKWFG